MRLLMQGSWALGIMEANGMPVSSAALDRSTRELNEKIDEIETHLRQDPIYKAQQSRFGKDTSLGSRGQLATILYDEMGILGAKKSYKTGKYVMDDDVLEALENEHNLEYISKFRSLQGYLKVRDTYISALHRFVVDGRIHGDFNLHTVKSYRSSASDPNLTNMPSRDPAQTAYIKRVFVPRDGYRIVEIDYSSLEVRIGCCYHKDPTMLSYMATDYDMHTEISQQCYLYDSKWIEQNKKKAKILRSAAKGDAVFGWQYGNFYIDVCLRLWKTANRQGMIEHLASKGITRIGISRDADSGKWIEKHGKDAFVTHIKAVEDDFWGRRFRVYKDWKEDFYRQYLKLGYFKTHTGFVWHGVEKRNAILNIPIQGSGFHCLLEAIIQIQQQILKRKMDTLLICQIHDSLLAEVPESELEDYVAMAQEIMTLKVREKWGWIITDLPVEVETSDTSWYDKTSYTLAT